MARRKLTIQRDLGKRSTAEQKSEQVIDSLTSSMATVDLGFEPTDQRVYKIDLARIFPDPTQPRHFLPHDLRIAVNTHASIPADALQTLLERAKNNDTVARLLLGGSDELLLDEEDDAEVEEKSLFALARSIQDVGLRQPINVYQIHDPNQPDRIAYRIGEGERRFWAHHLLVLRGQTEFKRIKAIVDALPSDKELIYQRQAAENAARVDLPAIARARSIQRIKEQLLLELGTPVPKRELQKIIGKRVKSFTGRAVGDRMVRNYLTLLNLSPEAQDLAEAGQLTEKQLRPIMRLKSDFERQALIQEIINKRMSSRQVAQQVAEPVKSTVALREVNQTSVEERFEKRLLSAAKTVASLLSLPTESYDAVVENLAVRATDNKTRQVLQSLHSALGEVLHKAEDLTETKMADVPLSMIIPPITILKPYLPPDKFVAFMTDAPSGELIMEQLLTWQQHDVLLASRLHPFLADIETLAETVRAGDDLPKPLVSLTSTVEQTPQYELRKEESLYWAHALLVQRGFTQYQVMSVEILGG